MINQSLTILDGAQEEMFAKEVASYCKMCYDAWQDQGKKLRT